MMILDFVEHVIYKKKIVDSECIPFNTAFHIIFQNGHKTHLTEEEKEIIKDPKRNNGVIAK